MFEINGTPLTFITSAQWDDKNNTKKLDGQVLINNYQRHTWGAVVMLVPEYDSLFALEGQLVTINTIDFDDLLIFKEYQAILTRVDGTHAGINMAGVNLSFVIRI